MRQKLFFDNAEILIDAISGVVGGFVNTIIFYPFDTIMMRQQNQKTIVKEEEIPIEEETIGKNANSWETVKKKEEGIKQRKTDLNKEIEVEEPEFTTHDSTNEVHHKTMKEIAKKRGFLDLYKGLKVALIGNIVFSSWYFFLYRMWKNIFHIWYEKLRSNQIFMVTSIASFITTIMTNPFWQVQTRLCWDKERRSISYHVKEIYKEGGILAFWKGIVFAILLILNPIINFVVYEELRLIFVESDYQELGIFTVFMIGLISKIIATIISYPLLTLKTISYTSTNSESYLKLIVTFLKEEGFGAFYRGINAKLIRTSLSNSLTMIVFEKTKFALMNLLKL